MNPREFSTTSMADQGLYRIAIVGAATLKGKELKDILQDRNFPAMETKLLDDDESIGQIEAVGEEATFVQSVRAENFEGLDFAFFASDEPVLAVAWKMAADKGCMLVDLSYALEKRAWSAGSRPLGGTGTRSRIMCAPANGIGFQHGSNGASGVGGAWVSAIARAKSRHSTYSKLHDL